MRDKNRIPEFITYFVKGSDYLLSEEQYKKYYMCEPIHKSNLENTYYKVRCYYNAKTELYDRTLTDEREPWDNTSAFIHNGYIRKLSNEYAIYLYRFCKHVLSSQEPHQKFDHNMWKSTNNNKYKTQCWIDEYERLKSNGELDFIKKYIFDEKEI